MQLSFDNKNGNRITVFMFTQMMNGNIDYYMRYLLTSFQKKIYIQNKHVANCQCDSDII